MLHAEGVGTRFGPDCFLICDMAMTRACLRWGICGAGKISHDFVVGVKTRPDNEHRVEAVAARSVESASRFAETHDIERFYGSYEELAGDTKDGTITALECQGDGSVAASFICMTQNLVSKIDVVYVGTIHPTHLNVVRLMMEAGKPVLCEKPLTMNARDTALLIQNAKDKGVFLMEAMWTRCFPAVIELRKQIADGAIGDVKVVNISFGFKRNNTSGTSRLDDPKLGGGSVLDVGVYPISFATMVFGEKPENVYATGWLTATGVDEFAAITLKYSGQRVAQLSCSVGVDLVNDALVVGTKGTLKLPSPFWCPTKLEKPDGTVEYPLPAGVMPINFRNSEGLGYEAEEVRSCIKAGMLESEKMPLEHSQIVSEIMDSVMKQLGVIYYK